MKSLEIIKAKCDEKNFGKLNDINNKYLYKFIAEFVELFKPDSIFISDDSRTDVDYIRQKALKDGEESRLSIKGHTLHFDSRLDQARDKKMTKFLFFISPSFPQKFNDVCLCPNKKSRQKI